MEPTEEQLRSAARRAELRLAVTLVEACQSMVSLSGGDFYVAHAPDARSLRTPGMDRIEGRL